MKLAAFALLLTGCGGASLPPGTAELVDTVSRSVGTVSSFVEKASKLAPVVVEVPARIARGRAELKAGDPISSAATFFALAQDLRAAGVPIPDEVQAATDFLGQLAATRVQDFARAVSGRNPDGSEKP